ncbi:MAG: hypothetical protein EB126_09455 [Synechococcaceae bacterium WBB_10_009]|jgi:hypothetical protein|nr:hypothetical protein [Synechococcaceae bacterium WBB_10_009]
MSFDARSLERLQQLGRSLPQALPQPQPKPSAAPNEPTPASARRHRVETETDPQALFRALMQVSPDGTVPPHLMDRLRQAEQLHQADAAARGTRAAPSPAARPSGQRRRPGRAPQSAEEQELYGTFDDLLHLEDDGG